MRRVVTCNTAWLVAAWAALSVEVALAKILDVQQFGYGRVLGPPPVSTAGGVSIFVYPEWGCHWVSNDFHPQASHHVAPGHLGSSGYTLSSDAWAVGHSAPKVIEFRAQQTPMHPVLSREQIEAEISRLHQELQTLEQAAEQAGQAVNGAGAAPTAPETPGATAPEQP